MSRRTQKNVGVVGLGIIGRRVADCLRRRGFHVFVWNRTPRPYPNFVGSPAELAELCDFVQIFVSNDEALLQIVQQMKPSLKAHHVVMAHSTVAPATVRDVGEIVKRRGGQLLDAPFTGSKGAAETGELVYYVGGDDGAYRRAKPVLDASSKEIIEIGEIGEAMLIKVATNMITAATVQVAAEALALVERAGIPTEKFATAMRSNGSNSGTLNMKLPKMLSGDFDTQFSVKHMLKDVEIATRLARGYGLQLGVTEVARDGLREEADRGGADADYSAIIRNFISEPVKPTPEPELELVDAKAPEAPEEAEEKAAEPERQELVREPELATEPEREEEAVEAKREAEEPVIERELEAEEPAQRNGSEEHAAEVESNRVEEVEQDEPPVRSEPQEDRETQPESEPDRTVEARVDRDDEPEPEVADEREEEPEVRPEEVEIGNAATAVEPEPVESVAVAKVEEPEAEEPRGFFSRIFGRSADY